MYDFPEVRTALDALWDGIARYLEREGVSEIPANLAHDRGLHDLWNDSELFVSQCCGYDLVRRYQGRLQPVATPRYCLTGCAGPLYRSVVVVSEDSPATSLSELRNAVCVINGLESHSGMNSLRALVAPLAKGTRFFSEVKVSGMHCESLAMIARGEAEVAAIDSVSHALLARDRPPAVAGTRILARTACVPGIPYVTRGDIDEDTLARLRAAILAAFEDHDLETARSALLLDGIEVLPPAAYEEISELERMAIKQGYPQLQ